MTDRLLAPRWGLGAALVAVAASVGWMWSPRTAFSVAIGGGWNLASLFCLAQLLRAWLGPNASRRRVLGWLLVKFPLLYLVAFGLLRGALVSFVGFAAGFSVVLVAALGWWLVRAQRMILVRPHGR
jgi:hypothetical protein